MYQSSMDVRMTNRFMIPGKYLYKVIVLANKSWTLSSTVPPCFLPHRRRSSRQRCVPSGFLSYYEAMDMLAGFRWFCLRANRQSMSCYRRFCISVTCFNLGAERRRSETFQFVFQELQQVLPSLPGPSTAIRKAIIMVDITQPVVNFLLAKLALNAEIYMYDDWTQGYAKPSEGK